MYEKIWPVPGDEKSIGDNRNIRVYNLQLNLRYIIIRLTMI